MKIKENSKIEMNGMVMTVTGESETAFLGYLSNGKNEVVGQCSLLKSTILNPHYSSNIKLIEY